ncbi:hypothetical protein C2S52_020064 [Perilla frutescens var. hirtella]|nr:hypothetical protein C2S52_020064 [Perilla frutescens var. hirtella]KAH6805723.1 hypothetical protein C2S51_030554 [Perilla frutescens var. frutescens]
MSRHSQLPPRCPLQKKTVAPQVNALVSPFSGKDPELHSRRNGHHKIISENAILEEQPPWLNDLLSDLDLNSNSTLHRRAASDSSDFSTLLDGLEALPDLDQLNEKETMDSSSEPDDELGSSCMYGPNSPRRKNKLGFPENEIASAFSKYVMQNSLQHLDGYSSISAVQSDPYTDARASADGINYENKPMKRHPGQRSRARKLQYISELERTVNVYQNLGSELAVRVDSLIQQYSALSMENTTLKQQLSRMKQKKFIVDNEYQSLNKEVERLRTSVAVSTTNKFHNRSRSADSFPHSDTIWNTFDMRKLDLN